ncbi:hypothetical protein [Aminobacter sp. MDW-2]|uniref:hypothetical protein n=1 Tax=Aminobacter sp. MDW-2 TaxID=2666139 RepID=UPI0012B123F4|nr:hypothetical protein [Aminobacter sp. MDW-2]MRX33180.1 hypothetical protein [Aminobacter sp. MDW-2]QNH36805.1 hypothetical protein H5P29_13415 [Aminobacter sp. MDW-2]
MMNAITPVDDKPKRQLIEVVDPIPVLDTSRFEHMQRIASVMAQSTLIPESLYKEGTGTDKRELPLSQIISNCFLVVNQSVRWGLDPFAVAQSVAVVRGKLCYEGKLVAAVLDAKLGVRLHHHFTGEPSKTDYRIYVSDQPWTEDMIARVKPGMTYPGARIVDGSVAQWSTGDKSPWAHSKNYRRMLVYRGARDWARFYEPAVLLGVYTPDEMLDLAENARASRSRDVDQPSVMQRLQAQLQPQDATQPREGFDVDFVTRETAALSSEAAIDQEPSDASPPSSGAGSGAAIPLDGSAVDQTAGDGEAEAGESEAQDRPDASPASDLTQEDRDWLKQTAKMLWAATGPGEAEVLTNQFAGIRDNLTPATVTKAARDKGMSILRNCSAVCDGTQDMADTLELIAGIAGIEPREIA